MWYHNFKTTGRQKALAGDSRFSLTEELKVTTSGKVILTLIFNIEGPLLLVLKLRNDASSANRSLFTRSKLCTLRWLRTNVRVNWLTASHLLQEDAYRHAAKRMRDQLNIVRQEVFAGRTEYRATGGARIEHGLITVRYSRLLTTKGSPQRPYVHVGQRCAEGCGTLAKTAVQGILCGRHTPSCLSVGLLPKHMWWIFISVLIYSSATYYIDDSSYHLLLNHATHFVI
jgi:hypothetical protein